MIYLLKEETTYLLKLLENQPPWWVKDKIIEKINHDVEEKENRKLCKHEFGEYEGKRVCCMKCGGYAEGMGSEWNLKKLVNPEKYKMPKFESPIEELIKYP